MEILQNLFENSSIPGWSAFLLGLMTAISPCPLATNITAIGYISKDVESKRKVFIKGIVYTLGRGISYTLLGFIIYLGAETFQISSLFQTWGEKLIGPLLIIIGLFMLGIIKISLPGLSFLQSKAEKKARNGLWGALLIGMAFALAFCPYSGVLYFGMLIPMTIESASGLYLPLIFAIGTGIPVVIMAWIFAYGIGSISNFYQRTKAFEKWMRIAIAILFIAVGVYYIFATLIL